MLDEQLDTKLPVAVMADTLLRLYHEGALAVPVLDEALCAELLSEADRSVRSVGAVCCVRFSFLMESAS